MKRHIGDILRTDVIPSLREHGVHTTLSGGSNVPSLPEEKAGLLGVASIVKQPFGRDDIFYVFFKPTFKSQSYNLGGLVGSLITLTLQKAGLWVEWGGDSKDVIKVLPRGRLKFKGKQEVPGFEPLLLWNIESEGHSYNHSTKSWQGLYEIGLLRTPPKVSKFQKFVASRIS